MLRLALSTVRARKGAFVGSFATMLLATTLVAACGILLETGIRAGIVTERYAAAAVVVTGHDRVATDADDGTEPARVTERPRVDPALVAQVAAVDGVRAAIPEVSFPARVVTGSGEILGGPPDRDAVDNSWGHAWQSAALTPFTLAEGREPAADDEVVLDGELADRAGADVGDRIDVQSTGELRSYTVTGIAVPPEGRGLSRQSALFFTTGEADRLAAVDGRIDAIGVLAAPNADTDALRDRVADALDGTGALVRTGGDRGFAEFLDAAEARFMLIELSGAFGGTALLVALFVVASTFALLVQQRTREIALLRAVAATPGQVRRMICREAQVVAVAAGIVGIIPAALLAGWLRGQFVSRGLLPESFALHVGPLPMLAALIAMLGAAWLAARIAARRASRIHPTEALGEAAVEPKRIGAGRLIAGAIVLALGAAGLVLSTQVSGEAGVALGASVVIPLVAAAGLFSPILARVSASLLGPPLRVFSHASGFLAVANSTANTRRLGGVITPLILAVGIGGVMFFQQTTIGHAAERQAGDGTLADRVVTGEAGLPRDAADRVRRVPGVAAATPVVQTNLIVEYDELGEPTINTFPAQGVDPAGLAQTLDLDVRDGDLGELRDGTVAIGSLTADTIGANVGEPIPLFLGDGTLIEPTVIAVYERGLGFGEFTLPRDTLNGHLTDPLDDAVLVRLADDADPAEVDAALSELPYAGLAVLDRAGFEAAQAEQQALDGWLNLLLGGVLLGYIAISVANSLIVGTIARARELALLRLIGTTRRQVLSMMRWEGLVVVVTALVIGAAIAGTTLAMAALGLTGDPVPYVPPLAGIALLAGTAALGMAAIMLSARYALRANPTDAIGMRE